MINSEELAELLGAGLSSSAIAERFGCTARTVRNTAHRHHLELPSERKRRAVVPRVPRGPSFPQLYEPGRLQQRCSDGVSLRSIAAEVGCSVSAVRRAANRLDVVRRRAVQRPELRDRDWLAEAYMQRRLSTAAIATLVGASDSAVSASLARAGIATRRPGRDPRLDDERWLRGAYVDEGLSAPRIATLLQVHSQTVYVALDRAGVSRRPAGETGRWQVDFGWLRSQFLDARRSVASIAAEVDRHPATVRSALARHDIRRPGPRRPARPVLIAAWDQDRSVRAVARRFGATTLRAEVWLAEVGVFVRPRPLVARSALRAAVRRGDNLQTLARRYQLSPMRMRVELLQHRLEVRPEART